MEGNGFGVIEHLIHAASSTNPEVTRRALDSISVLLNGVRESTWPEAAWSFSHLTGTGVPFEFSWSPQERAIRYTCEVAGPGADPAQALNQACSLLEKLTTRSLPEPLVQTCRQLQSGAELYYGAWIGGRHSARGDDFKLYAETDRADSRQTAAFLDPHFGPLSFLPNRPVQFRLFGYTLGSARPEFYFRVSELEVWELNLLLDRAGLYERRDDFLSLVTTAYGCDIAERLPGSNFGFSISKKPDEPTGSFSLFTYADCVFGSDSSTRAAILRLCAQHEWQCDDYAAMSQPAIEDDNPRVNHGMIAFVISASGPPALQVGMAPRLDVYQ